LTRRAIVLGSNGPEQGGPGLKYARLDAQRFRETLGSKRCGFDVELLDPSARAASIRERIYATAEGGRPEDMFVAYFSGHGYPDTDGLWLMLDGSDPEKLLTTAISANEILLAMRRCQAQHKLLVLDCCHAGKIFENSGFKDAAAIPMTQIVSELKQGDKDSTAFVAMMASKHLERARELDELQGGFLTHAISQALGPEFSEADADGDGAIDLGDLRNWVDAKARQYNRGRAKFEKIPIPFTFGRQTGHFYLTREPRVWDPYRIIAADCSDLMLLPLRDDDRAWCIGRTPVTNAQYKLFVAERPWRPPSGRVFVRDPHSSQGHWTGPFEPWNDPAFSADDQPVVCVGLLDATAYCQWLTQPSTDHIYCLPPSGVWNFAAFGRRYPVHDRRAWRQPQIHDRAKAPAGAAGAELRTNMFGVVDLLGNVWEWGPQRHPGAKGVFFPSLEIRGGSYVDDLSHDNFILPVSEKTELSHASSSYYGPPSGDWRDYEDPTRHSDLGFRIATRVSLHSLPKELVERIQLGDELCSE
jgi:Sulfatase-modifying factor enzyme 1/Caspase domain